MICWRQKIFYLSPCTKWLPHLEHEKHFRWNTWCWMLWGFPLLVFVLAGAFGPFRCDVVRITNSLAGIVWAHAEQAPLLPNSLQLKGQNEARKLIFAVWTNLIKKFLVCHFLNEKRWTRVWEERQGLRSNLYFLCGYFTCKLKETNCFQVFQKLNFKNRSLNTHLKALIWVYRA